MVVKVLEGYPKGGPGVPPRSCDHYILDLGVDKETFHGYSCCVT